MGAWWSEFHSAYAREIERIVAGQTLTVGPEGAEREITVARIRNVIVGIDSTGIFAAINVWDEDDHAWSLYNDGSICEYDTDIEVGRHNLKSPIPEPPTLADQARETARALHLAQFGDVA